MRINEQVMVSGGPGVRACVLAAALVGVSGCASLGAAEERNVRNVLHSERFVQHREVTRLSLGEPAAWATADRVSASVQQTWACRGAYREKVATTTITSHATKNVAVETILGLGLAAVGGVALAVAPGLSNTEPEPSESSPRERALILGGVGVGTGAILVGHAVWVSVKASDHESDAVLTEEVRAPDRDGKECGREVAGAGSVVASWGRREIALGQFPSGAVALNLRSNRDALCGDPNAGHESAKLTFVLGANDAVSIPLGEYPLKHCVMATTARRKLRLADTQLAGEVDGRRVAQAVKLIDDAGSLVSGLPPSDPDSGDLQLEVARLRTGVASKAEAVLKSLVVQSVEQIDAVAADAASSALAALDVSRVSNSEEATRKVLYAAFGRQRGERSYAGLVLLVEGDRGAKGCLQTVAGCPEGLPRERWQELVEPLVRSVAEAAEQSSSKLQTATKDLAKSQTPKTLRAFDAAASQAKTSVGACQLPLGALGAACSRLRESEREADAFVTLRGSELRALRQQIADKQRAEELKKTATRWRRHFAECSRLEQGERTAEAVGFCDDACEAVRRRMDAERMRLRKFEYFEIVDDPSLLGKLADECRAASCDVCP